jgi:hypothetical protein
VCELHNSIKKQNKTKQNKIEFIELQTEGNKKNDKSVDVEDEEKGERIGPKWPMMMMKE